MPAAAATSSPPAAIDLSAGMEPIPAPAPASGSGSGSAGHNAAPAIDLSAGMEQKANLPSTPSQKIFGINPVSDTLSNIWQHVKQFGSSTFNTVATPPSGTAEQVVNALGPGTLAAYRTAKGMVEPSVQALEQAYHLAKSGQPIGDEYDKYDAQGNYRPTVESSIVDAVPVAGPIRRQFMNEAHQRGLVPAIAGAGTDIATSELAGRALPKVMRGVEAAPEAASSAMDVIKGVPGAIPDAIRGAGQMLFGVDEKLTQRAVEDANDAYAKEMAERPDELRNYYKDVQAVKKAGVVSEVNPDGITGEQNIYDRKDALQAGQKKLVADTQDQLNLLKKRELAKVNQQYNAITNKVVDDTTGMTLGEKPAEPVRDPNGAMVDPFKLAALDAQSTLRGAPNSVSKFRSIIGNLPGETPTLMENGDAIYPGHPRYPQLLDMYKSAGVPLPESGRMTFNELQGRYSQLGDLLQTDLPGDVKHAVTALRKSTGQIMNGIADSEGLLKGKTGLQSAQRNYANYMTTFEEPNGPSGSGSPVAKATNAVDPDNFLDPFLGKAGDRALGMIADYDPELAKRFSTLRKINDEIGSIGNRPAAKPIPEMPAAPQVEPVDPMQVKLDKLKSESGTLRSFSKFDVAALASSAIAPFTHHGLLGMLAEPAYFAARKGIAAAIDAPAVRNWLAKPTEADMAALEKLGGQPRADVQQQMAGFIKQQRAAGLPIKLAPRVMAFIVGKSPKSEDNQATVAATPATTPTPATTTP